jgi:hypothetical protein
MEIFHQKIELKKKIFSFFLYKKKEEEEDTLTCKEK